MWKIIILLLLPCAPLNAQTLHAVKHLSGSNTIAGNKVTVKPIGTPRTGGGICGIDDYWIGNAANNGYEFNFEKPVMKLRLRLTAVNMNEVIRFEINGIPYPISEQETHHYDGECFGTLKSIVEDGNITNHEYMSNVEILLNPDFPISSLSIFHTNGKKQGSGVVFDLAIVEDNIAGDGTGGNSASTGISGTALQPGMFTMLPNPATETFRLAFLPSSSGSATVTITDMAGRKVQVQQYDCSKGVANTHSFNVSGFVPGNHTVELNLNEEHYVQKLVKL